MLYYKTMWVGQGGDNFHPPISSRGVVKGKGKGKGKGKRPLIERALTLASLRPGRARATTAQSEQLNRRYAPT